MNAGENTLKSHECNKSRFLNVRHQVQGEHGMASGSCILMNINWAQAAISNVLSNQRSRRTRGLGFDAPHALKLLYNVHPWDCHVLLMNWPFYHSEMPPPPRPWQYTFRENYLGLPYYSIVWGDMIGRNHEAGSGLQESSVSWSGHWSHGWLIPL